MGFYINPGAATTREKTEWLEANGRPAQPTDQLSPGEHFVCHVDNGFMSAAGIAFNDEERDAFNQPHNNRPKTWYIVPDAKLIEVCPHVAQMLS